MPNRRQFITAASTAGATAMTQPLHAADAPRPELPTTSLADLHRSVTGVIASKRIGQPVFLRLTLQTPQVSLDRLAELAELARQWVGQSIESLYAILNSGQLCLTIRFAGGATALVSLAKTPFSQGDGVDVLLIGNHGSVQYDAGASVLWDGPAAGSGVKVDPKLLRIIEIALKIGEPIPVKLD